MSSGVPGATTLSGLASDNFDDPVHMPSVVTGDWSVARIESPLGQLRLIAWGERLAGVYLENHRPRPRLPAVARRGHAMVMQQAAEQLGSYFAGARRDFELDIVLVGTAFQRRVWTALASLPYGRTCSYGQLAVAIGAAGAARAVGAANARNPLSIVLPCHRVVAADGQLAGYAGGVSKKAYLLELERHHVHNKD